MKLSIILLQTSFWWSAAAFVPSFKGSRRHSTAIKYDIRQHDATEPSPWILDNNLSRAMDCIDGECSVERMWALGRDLAAMPFEECMLLDGQEAADCEEETEGRATIQRVMELKQELSILEAKLSKHSIVDTIQKTRETEWKNHWFTDYMEFYHH